MLRQRTTEEEAKLTRRRLLSGARHDVGDETPLSPAILPRQDDGLAHGRVGQKGRLDLPRLDAEAADLHLLVHPPEVLQIAVLEPAGQIARPVQAGPWRVCERVGHEALGGEVAPPQVPARQPRPADVDLSRHADRHRMHRGVEQVDAQAGDRPADHALRPALEVVRAERPAGDDHGGLRDAVQVHEEGPVRMARDPRLQIVQVQRLAADVHQPKGETASARLVGPDELPERRGRLVQDGDPLAAQEGVERLGRLADQGRHDDQTPAVEQGAPHLPHGIVEGVGVEQRPDVVLVEAERRSHRPEQARDVGVRHHHALRAAGRAAGVDDVRRAVGERGRREVRVAAARGAPRGRRLDIQEDDGPPGARQPIEHLAPRQQSHGARIIQHERKPVPRVGRVERHVRAARLEDGENRHDHLDRTLQADRHPCLRPNALLS